MIHKPKFEYYEHIVEIIKKLKLRNYKVCLSAGLSSTYLANLQRGTTSVPNFECLYNICKVINKERRKQNILIYELRNEFGDNIIIDMMEMIEYREGN